MGEGDIIATPFIGGAAIGLIASGHIGIVDSVLLGVFTTCVLRELNIIFYRLK